MECSREFREELRNELPAWQSDGIVSAGAARAIASRYDLDRGGRGAPVARDHSASVAAAASLFLAFALALALVVPARLERGAALPLLALAAALAAAPLALRGGALARVAAAIGGVGRAVFYVVAFALTFVSMADALRLHTLASPGFVAAVPPFVLAISALAAGLRRPDVDPQARGEAMLLTASVPAFAAALFLDTRAATVLLANLSLALLATCRIVRGCYGLARGPFFEGLVVATALVASRVIVVRVDGWPRATGAFLVLAGAVAAATVFERRRVRPPDEARARAS